MVPYIEKFPWNPYLKTDSANFLILFLVNDFQKYICKNFYVMFLAIMYVLHMEKKQNAEYQKA